MFGGYEYTDAATPKPHLPSPFVAGSREKPCQDKLWVLFKERCDSGPNPQGRLRVIQARAGLSNDRLPFLLR